MKASIEEKRTIQTNLEKCRDRVLIGLTSFHYFLRLNRHFLKSGHYGYQDMGCPLYPHRDSCEMSSLISIKIIPPEAMGVNGIMSV